MKQLPFEDSVISIANTINLKTIMNFNFECINDRQTKMEKKCKCKCFDKNSEPLFDNNKYN